MFQNDIPSLATVPVLEFVKLSAHHMLDAKWSNKFVRLAHNIGEREPGFVASHNDRRGGFEAVHVYVLESLNHLCMYLLHGTGGSAGFKWTKCLHDILLDIYAQIVGGFAKTSKLRGGDDDAEASERPGA